MPTIEFFWEQHAKNTGHQSDSCRNVSLNESKETRTCNDVEYAYGEKVQTVLKAIARSCKESNGMISDSMLNIQLLQLMPQL